MIFKQRSLSIIFLTIVGTLVCGGQDLTKDDQLEALLEKAEKQSQKYLEVFKDLSAEETKIKLYYKKNGKLNEKRVIKSIFVVYRSPIDNTIQEFRNVFEYNGKRIDAGTEKTEKFFRRLAKSSSAIKEHIEIRENGSRFDGRVRTWGITLDQPRPFRPELKRFFEFKLAGREEIDGRETLVVEYKQTTPTLLITSSPSLKDEINRRGGTEYSTPTSVAFRPTNPLMNGKLWLDRETAQIWKNQFEIVLHPKVLSKPVTNVQISYEYRPSEFGSLLPKRFLIRGFRISGKNDATLRVRKDAESIYEYSKFSRFKTDARVYEASKNK
ncbi:MAG: hypothetical protein HKN25_09415 [Pyrinomonadaceae bacterium]|nr:hypothetical protein [Pyrinomonadaceae bacterium]